MQRDIAALIEGCTAGAFGTLCMSAVMMAGRKTGVLGEQPPEKLSEQALRAVGIEHNKEVTQDIVAVVLHWGFGMSMGALFGLSCRRIAVPISVPMQGIVFATAVWAVSYKGWIPALGIMPPPERDRPGRPLVMVLAHWVYGWTMGRTIGAVHEWRMLRPSVESNASAVRRS